MRSDIEQRTARVSLHLLGIPWLSAADGRRIELTRKDALVLAAAAIEGPLQREAWAARLWPHADHAGMLNNLRQRLHRLNLAARLPVLPYGQALRLDANIEHDLAALRGDGSVSPEHARLELLQGCEFGDEPEVQSWLSSIRERWLQLRTAALRDAHDHSIAAGRLREGLALAKRLVELDPWSEEAQRRVMSLLDALGERAEALQWYGRFAQALQREMGVLPTTSTQALARELARDLAQGEQKQPSADKDALRKQLAHPPRVIGRAQALATLETAFAAHDLMLIHGEPGAGKSRLAAAFAARTPLHLALGARWGDASQPYALMARMLQALFPHGSDDLPAANRSARASTDVWPVPTSTTNAFSRAPTIDETAAGSASFGMLTGRTIGCATP